MLDPISDMLTRIRNASRAQHATVAMPSSVMKTRIAEILAKEGFIEGFVVTGDDPKKTLTVTLKYAPVDHVRRTAVINDVRQVSRQGQRVYARSQRIAQVRGGYGIAIVSTSQGLMTGGDARKKHLGGEVICEVW